jgi:cation diffusion facilitator CzcD-associated flavoprotein CzcO
MGAPDHHVLVVGAGFSGIGAAIGLQRGGFQDLLLVEAGDGVGGAWHWNTYPGVAVDIPSFSYQFSFAQRTDWSRVYAPGTELKAYAEELVDRHGLRDRLALRTRITGAAFDDGAHLWRLATEDGGELTSRFVVGATGVLTQPKLPDIPGVESFAGTTMHTARWDHGVDLAGRRVAVVGTGASAVQLIPAIAEEVARLTVFQRTPIWCLPKPDAPMPGAARWALDRLPLGRRAARLASQAYVELTFPIAAHFHGVLPIATWTETLGRRFLAQQVDDPVTREKLTPRYSLGCKRPSFHNSYLATFNRPDVALETTPIAAVEPAGVRTADGVLHEVDVLVLATGFKVFETGNMPPFQVTGAGGRDLEAFWDEHRFQAYEGVSVPGFPNLFSVLGPYGYNGSSYFTLIENQTRHVLRLLRTARDRGATRVEVTAEANRRFHAEMLGRRGRQVFFRGSCASANSYYFDKHGDVPFRPSTTLEAAWRAGRFPLADYRFAGPVAVPV